MRFSKTVSKLRGIKGQEEMIGFGLVIMLVAVILLVILSFSLRGGKDNIQSFQVESFIGAFLGTTTDCQIGLEHRSIQRLITDCNNEEECSNGERSCEVLKSTIQEIIDQSWASDEVIRGYALNITSTNKTLISINKGNLTGNYKGGSQFLENNEIILNIYD